MSAPRIVRSAELTATVVHPERIADRGGIGGAILLGPAIETRDFEIGHPVDRPPTEDVGSRRRTNGDRRLMHLAVVNVTSDRGQPPQLRDKELGTMP
jgi:hypothetical protein